MKQRLKTFLMAMALLLVGTFGGRGQGFINFDFEQSVLTNDAFNQTVSFVPGWTAYIFGNGQENIRYNAISLGGAIVSMYDTNSMYATSIQGRYYIGLRAQSYYNYFGDPFPFANNSAISQTGQIPTSAKSIVFWGSMGTMQVYFNNFLLAFSSIDSAPNYTVYAADISPYAGQIGELRFEALTQPVQQFSGLWGGGGFIDNIQFSTTAVPEPSTLALFGFGAVILGVRRLFSGA
jgi:hypothetical protein